MINTNQKRILKRLNIIAGQVAGLKRMVEKNQYCVEVITQSLAAQKSLKSFDREMLKNHLSEHVAHQFRHGHDQKAIKELLQIYHLNEK